MEKEKSWKKITNIGNLIIKGWKRLAKKHGLKIKKDLNSRTHQKQRKTQEVRKLIIKYVSIA